MCRFPRTIEQITQNTLYPSLWIWSTLTKTNFCQEAKILYLGCSLQEIRETLIHCAAIIKENGKCKSQMKIFKWISSNALCTRVVAGADCGEHVPSLPFTICLSHTATAVLGLLICKWVTIAAIHLIGLVAGIMNSGILA